MSQEMEIEIERTMVIHLKNEATGSPRLRKRVVHARVAFNSAIVSDPAPIKIKSDTNQVIREFFLLKSALLRYFNDIETELRPTTNLERMVYLARFNILRPHSDRRIEIAWKVKMISTSTNIDSVSIKLKQDYDPPITMSVEINQSGEWSITIDFYGKKESHYKRTFNIASSFFNPIDVFVAKLAYAIIELAQIVYTTWKLVGNGAMRIKFDGRDYVLDVLYDSDLQKPQEQEQATTQDQNTSQVQEQAITQEAQSAQDTQVHQTDAVTP